ncbi:ferric reductase-like transmembrane domain-containing protein [Shimia ponticola]|uniref:ferric reductase-like transmembrane domain-containing protein n=1 Tax=Shimia ponticola TaxID=2582893 RepID=UPI0011BF1209|nr:ferric reductase-like transmembrane domain-containing protein [Shimia ponticola]
MSSSFWLKPRLLWPAIAVLAVGVWALVAAGQSPYLQYRDWVYVISGFAGIAALCLFPVQPILAHEGGINGRLGHRWIGAAAFALVLVHVGGLWITSPPDVIDALLFRSPTPFSVWGVASMIAIFALGVVAILRRRIAPMVWRRVHMALVVLIVGGAVLHTVLIIGTMGQVSKYALCAVVLLAAGWGVWRTRLS